MDLAVLTLLILVVAGRTYLVSDPKEVQGAANVPIRRREERIFATEPVELASLDKNWRAEPTSTQNLSSRGARVSTHRVWEPGSFLVIKSLRSNFSARARVVYWRSFSSSRFTIGLEFLTQEGDWPPAISFGDLPA